VMHMMCVELRFITTMEKENEWNYTAVSLYWQYKKVI